ncbi:transglutaminase family protein [Sphingomonas xinjiangensis]|uniref:Transglutaminase-like putative cysteine protease n=1 Tax=Sphingomonas xinjiangensis TaxID=643568 RepID=A0A840YTC3_9SPHN|nr:transglutaminase family protein [Sphingomonas xinjiangensis]MBB5712920.1 transglutaminase-like putative cysteine protease [Sphingomonas xinjiangensis]
MKLAIRHSTTYHYARPVALQLHRLLLFPRGSHELRVLNSAIRCTPNAALNWSQDVFGNLVATASFAESAKDLVISSELIVEQCAPAWPIFEVAPGANSYPFPYSEAELLDLGHLMTPQHPDPGAVVRRWARAFVYSSPTDTLSLLKDVNNGLLAGISYRIREEEGTQAPAETLSLASGSCRDIAALFIDAVRHLGFGARAVSGYLLDPDATLDDAGSTHAWAEVYLPGAGWIAFDPTHQRVGSANLVAVAVGRCNAQIMPISGGFVGAPEDFTDMEVRVSVRAV